VEQLQKARIQVRQKDASYCGVVGAVVAGGVVAGVVEAGTVAGAAPVAGVVEPSPGVVAGCVVAAGFGVVVGA